ncbi:MAG: hypothetical protein ACFFDB_20135, partial [Promethearchaeota archaeon]
MEFSLKSDAEFTFSFQFHRKLEQNLKRLKLPYYSLIIFFKTNICEGIEIMKTEGILKGADRKEAS